MRRDSLSTRVTIYAGFFSPDESEQLVHLQRAQRRGTGCGEFSGTQLRMRRVDPVGNRLVINREEATDTTQAVAFKVEFDGLLASLVVIAERTRLWRVLATACLTLQALTAGAVKA